MPATILHRLMASVNPVRLFQNSALYRSYVPRLLWLRRDDPDFATATATFLNDRFGAGHFLKPVLDRAPTAFFANGDDEDLQRVWAREQGMNPTTPLVDILIAQIEHHRTEVFYNLDPMRYGNAFLARLPGCVRRTIAWRAAPSAGGDFLNHDIIVNNFPGLLSAYRAQGARAEYFTPAHDPEMDVYAANTDRPIDVLFVGGYSRYHLARAKVLEMVAALAASGLNIVMHLDRSRFTALAESPIGWIGPLRKHRRPLDIRKVSKGPVFGRQLLTSLGQAKLVINGAIDMAGFDRGNMRVWEALGCGAALVSDDGRYPEGMDAGLHFVTYTDVKSAHTHIVELLADDEKRSALARRGHELMQSRFSKQDQWAKFQNLPGLS
jgi:hypothetical protein